MLRNYFKIAIAVLKRRKFFTFISLFGISFTLTILIVLTAFMNNLLSANYPDTKRDRSLYINNIVQKDTKNQSLNSGPVSFYFLNHFAGSLKTPAKLAISSVFTATNTYVNNKKLVINIKYTNAGYWDVLEYKFLEGKAYTKQQIDNGDRVAVISEETKKQYFGDEPNVTGKFIETDNVQYRVAGVVKNVPVTMLFCYGDIYIPYTLSKEDYTNRDLNGGYTGILLANSKKDLPGIKDEFQQMVAKIPMKGKEYDQVFCFADSYLESFTRSFGNSTDSGLAAFFLFVGLFVFLFMLLPALNLVNINISRIMERSSEIGVRKAFGASTSTLVYQFIIENLILTILGGIIGIIISFIVITIINNSNLIPNAHLEINLTVLFAGLFACLFFGLLSGVFPAWRMARMEIVKALKA